MGRTLGRRARAGFGLVAVGLVTVLATGACGGSGGFTSEASNDSPAAAPAQGLAEQDSSGNAKTGSAAKLPVRAEVEQRSMVYKGELTVRASNVDEAAAMASTIATGAGGAIAGDNRRDDDGKGTADLVIRVPSDAFAATVEKLSDLGTELNRGLNREDVTEAVVDLDSRIASQKASVDRTRALLARAQQISDIVTIESELARREAELGSLQARKRSLADQVTLSTITVHLVGPASAAKDENEDEPDTFLTGLSDGWNAFTATVNGLLVVFGALLPFLIALGIPAAVLIWALRRRRQAVGPPAAPLGPPAPAPES